MNDEDNDNQDTGPDGRDEHPRDIQASTELSPFVRAIPAPALSRIRVLIDRYNKPYLQVGTSSTVYDLEGDAAATQVLKLGADAGIILRPPEHKEVMDGLRAYGQLSTLRVPVWGRNAATPTGLVLNVCDETGTQIHFMDGTYRIIRDCDSPLFAYSPTARPLPIPESPGDLGLLDQYLNLLEAEIFLLKAYASYVIAHVKIETTNFPVLFISGGQGCGKSVLCRIIKALVDPDAIGLQAFPRNDRDLAIATEHAHLVIFDNVRDISPAMADLLCIAATGGARPTRKLYTNAGQFVHRLHAAVVINSIHPPPPQSDLAQRGLYLTPKRLDQDRRRGEREMIEHFQADLPRIFGGLLELIAEILLHYPAVEPTDPERMFEFSAWLAAMERVDGVPVGTFQFLYSTNLSLGMLDALMEHPLASAVVDFMDSLGAPQWTGEPATLLETLSQSVSRRTTYSKDWPQTPGALSLRLKSLQVGLARQGIEIRISRGHKRKITITRVEAVRDE